MGSGLVSSSTMQYNAATSNKVNKSSSVDNTTNYQNFLTLFTTQLKYQTPDNTVDSSQMMSQLASFSGVEQQTKTNNLLEKLVASQGSTLLDKANSYIGKTVDIDNSFANLTNNKASFTYNLPADSISTMINILDKDRNIVFNERGKTTKGTHDFIWDGKNSDKSKSPDDTYQIIVSAIDKDGVPIPVTSFTSGVVSKSILNNNVANVIVNDRQVPLNKILSTSNTQQNLTNSSSQPKFSDAITYIGKSITADLSNITLLNGKTKISYNLADNTAKTEISVFSQKGELLGSIPGYKTKGSHTMEWNGKLNDKQTLSDGNYKFIVTAAGSNGMKVATDTKISGLVTKAKESGNSAILTVNGIDVPINNITSVALPTNNEIAKANNAAGFTNTDSATEKSSPTNNEVAKSNNAAGSTNTDSVSEKAPSTQEFK